MTEVWSGIVHENSSVAGSEFTRSPGVPKSKKVASGVVHENSSVAGSEFTSPGTSQSKRLVYSKDLVLTSWNSRSSHSRGSGDNSITSSSDLGHGSHHRRSSGNRRSNSSRGHRSSSRGRRSNSRGHRSGSKGRRSTQSRSRSTSISVSSGTTNLSFDEDDIRDERPKIRRVPKGSSKDLSQSEHRTRSSKERRSKQIQKQRSLDLSPGTNTTASVTVGSDGTSSSNTRDILYGHNDEKSKMKKSRSSRAVVPGVEHVSKRGSRRHLEDPSVKSEDSDIVSILYADEDAKAKNKSRSSKRSSKPGMESVSHSISSGGKATTILYGDEDAKAKAKSSSSQGSSRPGVESLSSSSDHAKKSRSKLNLLYGDDKDAKNKAKVRSNNSRPGVYDTNEGGTRELLYGDKTGKHIVRQSSRDTPAGLFDPETESSGDHEPNDLTSNQAFEAEVVKRKTGRPQGRLWIVVGVLAFLFLLVVGGVTAFVMLGGNEEENPTDTSMGNTTTFNNTIFRPVTPSPSLAPVPGINDEIYDPPSPEECEAIANNDTIAGRENMTKSDFNVHLDVSITTHGEVSDEMVQQLMDSLQQLLLPALAGCNMTDNGRRLVETKPLSPTVLRGPKLLRQLQIQTLRYVIFDAFVSGIGPSETECQEETAEQEECFRLIAGVTMYLKGPTQVSEIEGLVSQEWQGDNNLVPFLELPAPFSKVKVVFIDASEGSYPSGTPTDFPSTTPTGTPSFAPTIMPVFGPTPPPTRIPTKIPTLLPSSAPTNKPVVRPTPPPTKSPTNVPTLPPSSAPTNKPVFGPTPPPTKSPTKIPTLEQTTLPTSLPSGFPSANPSARPSTAPTTRPSTIPTGRPSESPSSSPSATPSVLASNAPTVFPSASPSLSPTTHAPSTAPSANPTNVHSAPPSITTFHMAVCGRPGLCGGKLPTLQNSNYNTLDGVPNPNNDHNLQIAFRCCSDSYIDGFLGPMFSGCPYIVSEVEGVCYSSATYHEGESICAGIGARLCTQTEMENDCGRNSGCGHNDRMIWTSNTGP